MRMYYPLRNDEHFNKLYGVVPEGSGFSTIPYHGRANKYNAKPLGLPMPSLGTAFANVGYAPQLTGIALAPVNNQWKGPINSIYEVQFSGFAPSVKAGYCLDCTGLNRTYLVHQHTNVSEENDPFTISDSAFRKITWHNNICDIDNYSNLCGYSTVTLKIASSGASTGADYQNYMEVSFPGSQALIFRKQLGYYNTTAIGSHDRKPLMMEGEHVLQPVLSEYNMASGDYSCNYDNVVCLVRPYKSNFYDIKNAISQYSSGNNYYHLFQSPLLGEEGHYLTACNQYMSDYSDGLITSPLVTNYFPQFFNLSISGVRGNIENKVCTPGNEYYNNKFKLSRYHEDSLSYPFQGIPDNYDDTYVISVAYSGANVAKYKYVWSGVNEYRKVGYPPDLTPTNINANFHNICDFGCKSQAVENTRGFGSGTCNNMMQLDVVSTRDSSNNRRCDAYLYLGATQFYTSIDSRPASKLWYKNLCDDLDGRPCRELISDPHGSYFKGNVPCFSGTLWTNNWNLIPYSGGVSTILNTSSPSVMPANQDVFNQLDFSNTQPQIQPFNPNIPCKTLLCHVCDGNKVPYTVAVSATHPTTGVVTNVVIPLWSVFAASCIWTEDIGSGWEPGFPWNPPEPIMMVTNISGAFVRITLVMPNPAGPQGVSYLFDIPNTGGSINYHINCNSTITSTGSNSATITFGNFVNIQDYI